MGISFDCLVPGDAPGGSIVEYIDFMTVGVEEAAQVPIGNGECQFFSSSRATGAPAVEMLFRNETFVGSDSAVHVYQGRLFQDDLRHFLGSYARLRAFPTA